MLSTYHKQVENSSVLTPIAIKEYTKTSEFPYKTNKKFTASLKNVNSWSNDLSC